MFFPMDQRETLFSISEDEVCDKSGKNIESDDYDEFNVIDIRGFTINEYIDQFNEVAKALNVKSGEMKYDYANLLKHVMFNCIFDEKKIAMIKNTKQDEFNMINTLFDCSQVRYRTDETFKLDDIMQLDANSMFPYILTMVDFPYGKPMFKNIDNIVTKDYKVAYFKLKVEDLPECIYQKRKKTQWFSVQDVLILQMFGCEFELIKGEEYNCIHWDKTMRLNNKVVKDLFALKTKGNKIASIVVKRIHGCMMSRIREKKSDIGKNVQLHTTEMTERKYTAHFPLFYRIKTCIYAIARLLIAKQVKRVIDDGKIIIRICTDSITFENSNILDDKISDIKMGFFKDEKVKKYGNLDATKTFMFNNVMEIVPVLKKTK